jgi:homoaconitase/3-isopropylmalate dehydratase large subunit
VLFLGRNKYFFKGAFYFLEINFLSVSMWEYKAMGKNVTRKLIESHLIEGRMIPGEEIGLKIDQTLTQDATGTLVMLEFEAFGISRVRTELSAQYVDHNLLQEDFKNADDHLFLRSTCKKFGLWYGKRLSIFATNQR